jgi:hypothetical protein
MVDVERPSGGAALEETVNPKSATALSKTAEKRIETGLKTASIFVLLVGTVNCVARGQTAHTILLRNMPGSF